MTARLSALPALKVFLLIGALLLAGATPAAAADSWRVRGQSQGLLHRLPDSSDWQPSLSGLELPPGTSVQASNGTAMLAQADNHIIMLSGGELTLPQPETEIVAQRHRRIRYQIRPGSTHNFGVQTPYLAIGIKGTMFDVLVSAAGAEVRVLEGRVAVSTPDGRYRVDLTPSQAARIGAAPGSVLEVQRVSGQATGQAPRQAFAPASRHHSDAPAVPPAAADTVRPAGYQHEPLDAVSEAAAAVTGTTEGVLGRLSAGIRDLLSDLEVIPDERLRSAPRKPLSRPWVGSPGKVAASSLAVRAAASAATGRAVVAPAGAARAATVRAAAVRVPAARAAVALPATARAEAARAAAAPAQAARAVG
ncbi:MAG TPA: FecR domain-containing protein [Geminicoccaceae bacterium]|nr:FecR domain-containing protein [Geminicoccaceae bacterium]